MRRLLSISSIKYALCIFYALHFYHGSFAQESGYNFINFSNKDGLSSSTVNTILKDKYGYMWFGTDDGLNRFDGTNFHIYRHNTADTNSIGGNNILSCVEDRDGNLWVGTDFSLSFFDRKRDIFINYDFVKNIAIKALAVDHQGFIWIGTYGGLYRFDPLKKKSQHYGINTRKEAPLLSGTVVSLYEDSRRKLWIGTNKGLNQYIREKDNFISFVHSSNDPASIANNTVLSITEDAKGTMWFGTDSGLSELPLGAKGFRNYRNDETKNSLSNNRARVVMPEKPGVVWVGTERGLNILDRQTNTVLRINNDPRNKYSLSGKTINSIYIDNNGIYWVGTFHHGVNKYDRNLTFFNHRQSNPLDPLGLSNPVVTSFVEDPSGNLFVGTDGGGLNHFDRQTGLFKKLKLGNETETRPLTIMTMGQAGDELLVGTYQQGLYMFNMRSGGIKHFLKGKENNTLSGNDVFCVKKDQTGKVWIGSNGQGVNVFDPATQSFERFEANRIPTGERLLKSGYIRALEEDRSGNIWIGTQGSGIAIYDRASNSFRAMNMHNHKLPSNNIFSIYADRSNNVWVGTSGQGLLLFQKNADSYISFSEADGLSNSVIYKILEDETGKLWLSTNNGISSFDPKTRKFKNYTFQNGLQRNMFCLGSGLKTSKGELFFGGLDGFNYFDPASLRCNKNIPAIAFTDLKMSNRSVNPGENSPIKEHISVAGKISLDYKQNFSLEFAALNYTSPLDNRYSYKLDGFDTHWNEVGSLRTASYMNLPPGSYTFRVRAHSDDGLWTTPEKTISIYVKPPFWLTIYAYIFYIVAAVLLIALVRYRSIRKIKNRFAREQEKLQFHRMIEEEKRERQRQHEFDELKIKFLTNLSHEFRTPISLIMAPVDKLINQEASIAKQSQLSMVKRNTQRLLNLVNQLLDFRKMHGNELKLNPSEGDIISFSRDIAESFKDIAETKQVQFSFSSSVTSYLTRFDHDKIERILLNLLSNAFKFTGKGGEIKVNVAHSENSSIKIIVEDSGIGMTPEVKEKVFDRFFQAEDNGHVLNQGSGVGLSIVREFVKLHGGTISIDSKPGKGSTFTVELPCILSEHAGEAPETLVISDKGQARNLPARRENNSSPKLTVLLVEDNDEFRHYLRDHLKDYYRIVEACDGKEGWSKALSSHPHIIVSDISMPGIDGITLSRKIKSDKRTRHIPIILLTALTGHANHINGLQTGASDYLTKPFNFEILNVKIRNLITLNRDLKQTYNKQLEVVPSGVEVEVEDRGNKLLTQVINYIEANIDSPNLTVEEMSKHVFLSRGTLYNKIIELTGETPVEFIRTIKLKKAAALLEKSDLKIGQVGYMVGFSSPNYFAKMFKEKFNLSPSEYATQKRKIADTETSDVKG